MTFIDKTKATPFSLRIFVADGDPDGLRLVDRSNWIGKAVMFPRTLYTEVRNREEFAQTGVYLLLGPRVEGDGEMLYIGEGDPVRPRLESHYARKDFWTRAVFFVAGPGQLNKAHVQYLEARLVALATAAKRMPIDNGNMPTEPTLSEADKAAMDVFLHNILGMLPVLGIYAFEKSTAKSAGQRNAPLFTCKGRGALAEGRDTTQGFVVLANSLAADSEAPSLKTHAPNVSKARSELLKNGVLKPVKGGLRFTQDYIFTSPSYASCVVLGRTSNGRRDWKDASGRSLNDLEKAQTEA